MVQPEGFVIHQVTTTAAQNERKKHMPVIRRLLLHMQKGRNPGARF